jgi:hypothetical protein
MKARMITLDVTLTAELLQQPRRPLHVSEQQRKPFRPATQPSRHYRAPGRPRQVTLVNLCGSISPGECRALIGGRLPPAPRPD